MLRAGIHLRGNSFYRPETARFNGKRPVEIGSPRRVDGGFVGISDDAAEVQDLLGNIAKDDSAQASAVSAFSTTINAIDHLTRSRKNPWRRR